MSAREALIQEIQKQPEPLLQELRHYLAFLVEQYQREAVATYLSPVRVEEVQRAGVLLRFRQPLELAPTLDDTGQLLCPQNESLGIDVFAPTRQDLLDELQEQVVMLWREYACAKPDELTPAAQKLRQHLLNALEEVRHAA